KEKGARRSQSDGDSQPAAALPAMVVKSAARVTAYDARCAIHESRFSARRSCTRLPSQDAIARRQTPTWIKQMASMRAVETSAPTAQTSPGPAPANDGNTATAAAAATTATIAHTAPISVSRR